jgi:hypothetical protein
VFHPGEPLLDTVHPVVQPIHSRFHAGFEPVHPGVRPIFDSGQGARHERGQRYCKTTYRGYQRRGLPVH